MASLRLAKSMCKTRMRPSMTLLAFSLPSPSIPSPFHYERKPTMPNRFQSLSRIVGFFLFYRTYHYTFSSHAWEGFHTSSNGFQPNRPSSIGRSGAWRRTLVVQKKLFATKSKGITATGLGLFSYLCNNTPKNIKL